MRKSILWWILGLVVLAIVIIIIINMSTNTTQTSPYVQPKTVATTTPSTPYSVSQEFKTQDVVYVAEHIGSATKFASIMVSTRAISTLNSTTTTIFVPTDAAFSLLPAGYINNLSATTLKRLVQYHVVPSRSLDTDATNYGTIQAMSKDALNFSSGPDKLPRVNSSVIIKQYPTKNGIVYLINAVLIPPAK